MHGEHVEEEEVSIGVHIVQYMHVCTMYIDACKNRNR